jgi:hypothetical protein
MTIRITGVIRRSVFYLNTTFRRPDSVSEMPCFEQNTGRWEMFGIVIAISNINLSHV